MGWVNLNFSFQYWLFLSGLVKNNYENLEKNIKAYILSIFLYTINVLKTKSLILSKQTFV